MYHAIFLSKDTGGRYVLPSPGAQVEGKRPLKHLLQEMHAEEQGSMQDINSLFLRTRFPQPGEKMM